MGVTDKAIENLKIQGNKTEASGSEMLKKCLLTTPVMSDLLNRAVVILEESERIVGAAM